MDAQTVSPIVPKFGMGLDGHLGRIIGYNNNNNNDDDNDNNDNNITTPYNREPLSSVLQRYKKLTPLHLILASRGPKLISLEYI